VVSCRCSRLPAGEFLPESPFRDGRGVSLRSTRNALHRNPHGTPGPNRRLGGCNARSPPARPPSAARTLGRASSVPGTRGPRTAEPAGSTYGYAVPPRRRSSATMSAATRARYARRRQRRLSRVDNDLTADQWAELLDAWGGCAYCQGDGPALQ